MGEISSALLMDCRNSVGMTVRPLSITPVARRDGLAEKRGCGVKRSQCECQCECRG
jgi:hypothetical protein